MIEVFIVDHRYYHPEKASPEIAHIAYASTLGKAKALAEKHRGEPIPWKSGYDSVQSQIGGLYEYIIYTEMIDQFTNAAQRFMAKG